MANKCRSKNPNSCISPRCPERKNLSGAYTVSGSIYTPDMNEDERDAAYDTLMFEELGLTPRQVKVVEAYADFLNTLIWEEINFSGPDDFTKDYDIVGNNIDVATTAFWEDQQFCSPAEIDPELNEFVKTNPEGWEKALIASTGNSREVMSELFGETE